MKIGELAAQSGVSCDTLRFYEQRGLIVSRRADNGYRIYAPETVELVRYIRTAQALGFTLQEIGINLPDVWHAPDPATALATLFRDKVAMVEGRIAALQTLREQLLGRIGQACPLQPAP